MVEAINISRVSVSQKEDGYQLKLVEDNDVIIGSINLTPATMADVFNSVHNLTQSADHRYTIVGTTEDGNKAILTIDSDTNYIVYSDEINKYMVIYRHNIGQGILNPILEYAEYEHVKAVHTAAMAENYQ